MNGAPIYTRAYYGLNAPARGGSLAAWFEMYVYDQLDHDAGLTGGEPAGLHVTSKAHWGAGRKNGHMNIWGCDVNVGGPNYGASPALREGYLGIFSGTIAKLTQGTAIDLSDPDATKRSAYGITLQIAPYIGVLPYLGDDSWANKRTYPIRTLFHGSGYTGESDGVNAALDGHDADADLAFEVGLHLGGWGGPWINRDGGMYNSKYGTGILLEDYVYYGLRIRARHPGGVAPSIHIERGGGAMVIDEELRQSSLYANDNAAYVNRWQAFGAATGGYLRLVANGGDADIGVSVETKGAGWGALTAGIAGAVRMAWNADGIGFFGTTPVGQQTIGAALATDGSATDADITGRINQIRAALINLGVAA